MVSIRWYISLVYTFVVIQIGYLYWQLALEVSLELRVRRRIYLIDGSYVAEGQSVNPIIQPPDWYMTWDGSILF